MIWEDHFYPEIIHPKPAVLPDGELGELVFTSLTRRHCRWSATARDLARLLPPTTRLPAHEQDHWPLGRHAHHPRRQPLPRPHRGTHPQAAATLRPLPARVHREGPARPDGVLVEVKPEFAHASGEMKQAAAGLQHEIKGLARRDHARQHSRPRTSAAAGGEGAAGDRQADGLISACVC